MANRTYKRVSRESLWTWSFMEDSIIRRTWSDNCILHETSSYEQPNSVSFLLLWQAPALLLSTFSGKTTLLPHMETTAKNTLLIWQNNINIASHPSSSPQSTIPPPPPPPPPPAPKNPRNIRTHCCPYRPPPLMSRSKLQTGWDERK